MRLANAPEPLITRSIVDDDKPVHDDRQFVNLHWYIDLARKWSWLFILVTVLAAGATYLYTTRFVKATYQSTTTLEVDVAQVGTLSGGSDVIASEEYAPTAAQLVVTQPVAVIAYKALHLGQPITPRTLLLMSHAAAVPNSQLIELSASSHDPVLAANVANAMGRAASALEQQRQASRYSQAQDKLTAQIKADEADLKKLRSGGSSDSTTASQVAADQAAIRSLQQRQLDLAATAAQSATTLNVAVPAQTPQSPVSPRPLRSSVLVGCLAFLFTLGVFVVREYLRTTMRTPEEITAVLGGPPVLGAILRSSTKGVSPGTVVIDLPRSRTAEAYRMVRTNLLFARVDSPPKLVLVTSANQAEGKTTTVLNLAASMAELGNKVLVIDADLRRPAVHNVLGLERGSGLSSLIVASGRNVQSVVKATKIPNLFVMTSGPLPPNPAEVLSTRRMRQLLDNLSTTFDVVFIDSPPLLAVADSAVLSTMVDTVLLVADPERATRQGMYRARQALDRVGTGISGVILNKLSDDRRGGYYYYYYYGSSSVYNYEHTDDGEKNGHHGKERPLTGSIRVRDEEGY